MDAIVSKAQETADFFRQQTPKAPPVALILGSGLSRFADERVEVEWNIPFGEIPHFSPTTVEGHPGKLIYGKIGSTPVVIMQGRTHLYEGHSCEEATFYVRALSVWGVESFLFTNAAGGLDPKMTPGELMIITDHINLTGQNPLLGKNIAEWGPRFVDMTKVYDPQLQEKAKKILEKNGVNYHMGSYAGVMGPSFETAAEIRYLQSIGASGVGMSTVLEVIVARHMNRKVFGMSCITNMGTGMLDTPVNHDLVAETAEQNAKPFGDCLEEMIKNW